MDVIFIEDRKEFDSITRNENLKYVQENRNTVLLTPDSAGKSGHGIFTNDIKLSETNIECSIKYISKNKNVYSLGNAWIEIRKSSDIFNKKYISTSLGVGLQYYKNLKKALENVSFEEYREALKDSFEDVMTYYNPEMISSLQDSVKSIDFCKRFALFNSTINNLYDYASLILYTKEDPRFSGILEVTLPKVIRDINEGNLYTLLNLMYNSNLHELSTLLNYQNEYKNIEDVYNILIGKKLWECFTIKIIDDRLANNDIVFKNDNSQEMLKNIITIIGANGAGKSFILSKILNDHRSGYIISLDNSFQKFEKSIPLYKIYINSKDFSKDHFFRSLASIVLNERNLLSFLLSRLEDDPLFSALHIANKIDSLYEIIHQKLLKEKLSLFEYMEKLNISDELMSLYAYSELKYFYEDGYYSMSDGQRRILEIILQICCSILTPQYVVKNDLRPYYEYNISYDSESRYWALFLIDEPENSLHPPYIATLIKIIKDFQDINIYSSTIIATHSPMIVQEFTSDMVRIVRREVDEAGNHIRQNLEMPSFETYGENIGILTDRIFGRDPLNTGFRQTLKDIVNSLPKNELFSPGVREEYIYPKIGVTSLGMEASMVLNGLISSRRKNIELKEKNSEDSH